MEATERALILQNELLQSILQGWVRSSWSASLHYYISTTMEEIRTFKELQNIWSFMWHIFFG